MVKEKMAIDMKKVDRDIVIHYLGEKFGLATDGNLAVLVERLRDHMENTAKQHLGDCDNCGGIGDVRLPVCPFCGIGDEEDQVASAVSNNPNATIAPSKPPKVKESDLDDDGDAEDEDDEDDEEDSEEDSAPEVVAPKKSRGRPKKVDQHFDGTESSSVEPPAKKRGRPKKTDEARTESTTTALAKVPTSAIEIRSPKDLDKNVAKIQKLKTNAVLSYWDLGHAIHENYENRLYALRTKEDGSSQYTSFNQFVVSELSMSSSQAYILMDVAINFSREDVATIGVAKLRLVARLPKGDREEMLDKIRQEQTPLSEVDEEIRRRVGGQRRDSTAATSGGPGLRGGAAVGAKGTQANVAKAEVAVGMVMGRKTIQMVRSGALDKPAQTLSHEPYCEEQMLNGITVQYRLVKNEKGIALIIVRKQDKSAATAPSVGVETPPKKKRGRPPASR